MGRIKRGTGTCHDYGMTRIFATTRKNAEIRGLTFNLTKEEVIALTQQPCHYCGIDPEPRPFNSRGGLSEARAALIQGTYYANGIDRVDNNVGYELENCVPCCATCNHAKATMTLEQWEAWLDRIASFRTAL